ncbi:hypothetical protein ACFLZS_00035 [Patescibacteria group bacterium]
MATTLTEEKKSAFLEEIRLHCVSTDIVKHRGTINSHKTTRDIVALNVDMIIGAAHGGDDERVGILILDPELGYYPLDNPNWPNLPNVCLFPISIEKEVREILDKYGVKAVIAIPTLHKPASK